MLVAYQYTHIHVHTKAHTEFPKYTLDKILWQLPRQRAARWFLGIFEITFVCSNGSWNGFL